MVAYLPELSTNESIHNRIGELIAGEKALLHKIFTCSSRKTKAFLDANNCIFSLIFICVHPR